MKNIGRAIATGFVMLGGVGIAYVSDGCTASVCIIILMFFVWADA